MAKGKDHLPKPTVEMNVSGGEMTEQNVRAMLCNPIYAGIADFPPMINDEQWIRAAARGIEEDGAEQWLVNMLHVLRASLANHRIA
jgi:hypothetical protein